MNSNEPALHELRSENIAAALVRRGLPVEYAERTAVEFCDHYRDLIAELRADGVDESTTVAEAARRLGDPRTLVKKTVREYQRRYWCGRWPLVTFLLAPVPMWIAAYIATAWVMIVATWCLHSFGLIGSKHIHVAISSAPYWFRYSVDVLLWVGIPAVLTFGLARLARRSALGWQWVALAACVLAFSAGSVRKERATIVDPQTMTLMADPVHSVWISLPLIEPGWWHHTGWQRWYGGHPLQALQFLVPLAVAGLLLLRAQQLALRAERLAIAGIHVHGEEEIYEHAKCA
jgi:hypothetical protein